MLSSWMTNSCRIGCCTCRQDTGWAYLDLYSSDQVGIDISPKTLEERSSHFHLKHQRWRFSLLLLLYIYRKGTAAGCLCRNKDQQGTETQQELLYCRLACIHNPSYYCNQSSLRCQQWNTFPMDTTWEALMHLHRRILQDTAGMSTLQTENSIFIR